MTLSVGRRSQQVKHTEVKGLRAVMLGYIKHTIRDERGTLMARNSSLP